MTDTIWFRSNGPLESRFLSNFYPCDVAGARSAEHLYQASKTDAGSADHAAVLAAPNALAALRVAQQRRFRRLADPQANMRYVLSLKFAPGTELAAMLLATGDATLIEDNPGPWGGREHGANWLGHLLMELRKELQP